MATDTFAKIGDIKGESQDDKHKEEIELLSWSWGVNQTGTASHGSGAGAGKASFSDFSFSHYVDKASPNLMKACATGEHIKEATITQRKAGKGQQEYLIIKMNDILITNVAPAGANGDSGLVLEQVALQASKVDLEYKPQKADGSLDAGLHFKYDVKANKEG
ncbi:MAG TPA: type VI secretion system tube protein Hcp [Vicinamibacterales bacterium]|jgi:type VI secretion system secreted protein Hcp